MASRTKDKGDQQKDKGDHQNVARAASVIDALSGSRERGLRLTDVVEATGLGTATIHRLLSGLVAHGFVDHDKQNSRYFIGLKMIAWAAAASERYGLAHFVDEGLERLCIETQDTVYFSLISGLDSICVDRREGSYPIKTLTLSANDRRPLGIGAGALAMLSFQDMATIEKVLKEDEVRRLEYGITTEFLRGEIARTQSEKFALNAGNLIPGMSGVAVPLRKKNGQAIAAISVAALTPRLSGERLAQVVAAMQREAILVEELAADVLNSPFAKRYRNRRS